MTPPPPPARRIVGMSTKMYFSAARTKEYAHQLTNLLSTTSPPVLDLIDVFIIPDYLTISPVIDRLRSTNIWCGAQDASDHDSGAFTGEVSASVLAELGCRLVEVGHAERRRYFGETDEVTARKAAAVARNGMVPLICIGEKTRGETWHSAAEECQRQVESALALVPHDAEVLLAYEPVWAIGAAQPAAVDYVVEVTLAIKGLQCVKKRPGITRIIYGGSAGPGLFKQLKNGGVDGLFLGRFGHDPAQFYKTIQEVADA